jgi:predicted nuclease of restriction endonuclease-like (RecB) superfamily
MLDAQNFLYEQISELILQARSRVRSTVNQEMVQTYWQVGQLIVEEEQAGEVRAEYGKAILEGLADRLTAKFGKGFDASNLRRMRQFYQAFPICGAVRHKLSWTHYRFIIRVENEVARSWYMTEAANEGWSTRSLERQINSFYYERILSSQDVGPVRSEAAENLRELSPRDVLKDPYVLEFLELGERSSFTESELELGLISQLQSFLLELYQIKSLLQHIRPPNPQFWGDMKSALSQAPPKLGVGGRFARICSIYF